MKQPIPQHSTYPPALVLLHDGRPGLRGGLHVRVSEPALSATATAPDGTAPGTNPVPTPAILDFIASNERLDRFDEVIMAEGWRLETYRRNPVFQNAHQYGDILFTLGKALVTEVRGHALYQRVEFAVDANPFARIAYGLYRGGFLNAVSVGFIPLRWEDGAPGGPWRRRYLEQELLEVSAVGIPANPDALQIGLRSGAIDKADVRAAADLLLQLTNPFRSCQAAPDSPARASGIRSDEAQWLRLARNILELMKRT